MKIETPYQKENIIRLKRKGKLVAYISFRRIGKPKHGLYELTKIEVAKEDRRNGLATFLFDKMLKKIKFRKLFVTTHSSNTKARRFYVKMGMGFSGVLATLKQNRAQPSIEEEELANNMCPICIWPLKINEDGEKSCPMCNTIWR